MKKNVIFKIVSALNLALVAVAAGVMYSMPVNAYIDPSVTTFIIQAVAGVVVAAGAVFAVVWRKAKKKAAQVLHIDENAGKEVEDDFTEIGDDNDNK